MITTKYMDCTLYHHFIVIDATPVILLTRGENIPDTIDFFPEFMKITNYSSRYMAIHASRYLAKALQTPRPESPFQVVDSQLKSIRKLANIFDAEIKIPNRDALPTPL